MEKKLKVEVKQGAELNNNEIDSVNASKLREFKVEAMSEEHKNESLFVFVKDENDSILAHGQLLTIDNVQSNNTTFNIVGIGGIIANEKGQGFGKQLMEGIKEYLKKEGKIGVGFTGSNNIGFYEKCGFTSDKESLHRFVFKNKNQVIRNTTEEWVFYCDTDDNKMKKILESNELMYLPRDPSW